MDRRKFLESSAMAAAVAAIPMVNGSFFASPAFAGSDKPITFLSAENLTGNWNPTAHTALSQIIFEGFVFGYLTRAPMSPDNPDEIVFELATSMKLIDEHTLEFKLREGVKFHNGEPFTANDVKATFEYASQPDHPAQWYPGRAKGGRDRRSHGACEDEGVRVSGEPVLVPVGIPARSCRRRTSRTARR